MRLMVLFCVLFFTSPLGAFEPHPVTAFPVVGYREFSFVDEHYPKKRNVLVWYPVEPQVLGEKSSNEWDRFMVAVNAPIASKGTKKPVVVISHGYGGTPHQLSWLIEKLVYHGYIVLGVQHLDVEEGKLNINHWQRARDIQSIIDLFLSKDFSSNADTNRIGVAGFSLGGTTAILLAGGRATKLDSFAPSAKDASLEEFSETERLSLSLDKNKMSRSWKDSRVKAVFVMAPAWAWIFDEQSLKSISIPTYLVASSADNVLVTSNNAGFFAKHIPGSLYQTIDGKAGHYVFLSALNEPQRKKMNIPPKFDFLFQDATSVDRQWIQYQVAEEAVRFFNQSLQ